MNVIDHQRELPYVVHVELLFMGMLLQLVKVAGFYSHIVGNIVAYTKKYPVLIEQVITGDLAATIHKKFVEANCVYRMLIERGMINGVYIFDHVPEPGNVLKSPCRSSISLNSDLNL